MIIAFAAVDYDDEYNYIMLDINEIKVCYLNVRTLLQVDIIQPFLQSRPPFSALLDQAFRQPAGSRCPQGTRNSIEDTRC